MVWEEGDPDPIPDGWAGGSDSQIEHWQDEIDGAKETYHLFRHITNGTWLSYDGADAVMQTVNIGRNCGNAFWDGTSTNFCNGATADDVVAHEWGHAYTDFTHNLIYQWQAGALNEAYSDMWGETVDQLNGRGTDVPSGARTDGTCSDFGSGTPKGDDTYRWLLGEDASGLGGAIRDMWRPVCFGDPGKVSDGQYHCATSDQGGVHSNSGIPNHAFALLVDGGSYNGETVSAIGLTKVVSLFWRAGSVYQVPTSDFTDHADALEASCTDLIGATLYEPKTDATAPVVSGDVIAAGDCTEVADAIAAVELRSEPTQCNFTPLLDPDAPDLCQPAEILETFSLTDWESGLGSWSVGTRDVADPATFDTPDWAVVGSLPDNRAGQAAFVIDDPALGDCAADDESGVLYLESPEIDIPFCAATPRIAVDHWVATEDGWDGGNLKISVNGGDWTLIPDTAFTFNEYNRTLESAPDNTNPMESEAAFSGSDGGSVSGSWGQSQIDLAGIAAAGDQIQLRFDMGLDGCNGRVGWYVDDVHMYSCGSGSVIPDEVTLENDTLSGTQVVKARMSITGGPNLIIDGDSIEFIAGERIVLKDGVEIRGTFSAEISGNACQ